MTKNYLYKTSTIDDLIPYVNNSRTHSEEQVNQIAASIKEWGFTNPILVDENDSVIAGHGRLLAAQKLNITEVPCVVLDGLTEAQKKAYIIADNKLALNAGWDDETLALEIDDLKSLDFDIDLLGFTELELNREFGETDANEEWQGMPEFNNKDDSAFRSIIVHFSCQAHVDEFTTQLNQNITDKTKYLWYPNIEIGRTADKKYE